MIIFPIFIVLSLVLYIFFKVKILSLKDTLMMHFTNAKARIALGSFISFFGISQIVYFQDTVAFIVGGIFILIGILQISFGFKLFRHYRKEILAQQVAAD